LGAEQVRSGNIILSSGDRQLPGQATTELTPFKRVIGIDPSEKMVEQARLALPQSGVNQFEFAQGSAEDLSMLPDSSVDMIIAGLLSRVSK
jgi:ubiquinone/menaquinone biosynthesis C-methylase UbiE